MRRNLPVIVRSASVRRELDRRRRKAKRGHVASRDLERYYLLLSLLQAVFSESEARAMLAALRHTGFADTDDAPFHIVDEIVDHAFVLEDLPDRGESLITRLRALGPADQLALTDAIERCRVLMRAGHTGEYALREAGLVRDDEVAAERSRATEASSAAQQHE